MSLLNQKIQHEVYVSYRWVFNKNAQYLSSKIFCMASDHLENCSWGISCLLWSEQGKYPIFNTAAEPHGLGLPLMASTQPTKHTFHCKEIIKETPEGKQKHWLMRANVQNVSSCSKEFALRCQITQAQRMQEKLRGHKEQQCPFVLQFLCQQYNKEIIWGQYLSCDVCKLLQSDHLLRKTPNWT